MQPTQASNETRLPQAVLRRSAEIARKYGPQEPKTETDTPIVETAPQPAAEVTETDPRESDPAYWKQRFKVTEGVLKAERERAQAQVASHRQQVSELQEQIRTLQASPTAPQDAIDLAAYFTPEQIESYGEEQCMVVATAADKAAKAQAQKAIDAAVAPLRQRQVDEDADAATKARNKFLYDLTKDLPEWQEIDATDAWKAWLAQTDDSTGFQRQEVLTRHNTANNVAGVVKVFRNFLKDTKKELPQPPVAPHGTGANAQGSGTPPQPQAAFNPTPAQIKDYYSRAARNKVTAQEREQMDAWNAARNAR
jgi:hypothetical protein